MACLQDLPNEVLERIFTYLCGSALGRATGVCHIWRDVIESQLRVENLWRTCCIREIPEEMLLDLVGGFDLQKSPDNRAELLDPISESDSDSCEEVSACIPTLKAFDLNIDWKYVYKVWHCSARIKEHESKLVKAFSTFDSIPVVCCKVSGSYVITGHRNGSVCAWEWQTGQLKRVVAQHLRIVTDLALMDLLKSGPYGDKSCLCYHHHVISISKDHTIIVSPMVGQNNEEPESKNRVILVHHSHVLENVKVFGNSFAVSCMDNTVSVWRIMVPNYPWEKPIVHRAYSITGPPDLLQWIGFWKDKVMCVCRNTLLKVFSLKERVDWVSVNYARLAHLPYIVEPQRGGFRYKTERSVDYDYLMLNQAFLCWSKTIFLFSIDNHMWVSVDGQYYFRYELMEVYQSNVQCIALKAGIFAMGLEKGVVVAFKINEPTDLITLDISQPTVSVKLSEASIIGLDIGDVNGEPIISACTSESVYVITWESYKLHHFRYVRNYDSDSDSSF